MVHSVMTERVGGSKSEYHSRNLIFDTHCGTIHEAGRHRIDCSRTGTRVIFYLLQTNSDRVITLMTGCPGPLPGQPDQ